MSWWFFRSKAKETDADVDASSSPEVTPSHTVADRLLNLQRSVGNQSVQRIVAKSSSEAASLPQLTQSGGEPLPQETRQVMESKFGESFDNVRIHSDEEAAASTTALGANAFTTGRDVYFARGKFAPKSPEGERLLAHELTHVVQQEGMVGSPAFSDELSNPTDLAEREAEAVAEATRRDERIPTIVSAGKGIQRDVGWAQRGPLPDPYGTLLLLNAFAAKFLEAAKLIYTNPAAMKLVNEAEAAGIEFGGYAEDGPAKSIGRAYTSDNKVYVPKTQTDSTMAMRDFLFELNNALRAPRFANLTKEATKGSKGTLNANQFAYKMAEQEVEGVLRLGEIWFETKKTMPKGAGTESYDAPFFLPDYEAVKSGKKTKDDLVKEVLKRVYDTGTLKGKTVEQYYVEHYERLSGGK